MRVVAGSAGGRRLKAPAGRDTRPTSDRVREAIFNMLGSRVALPGASVVDLFAGSGAMGIEALSRGAAHATFVENDPRAIRTIEENLETTGFSDRATVARRDAMAWLRSAAEFDLAFVDPPYAFAEWSDLVEVLDAAFAVFESDREIEMKSPWRVNAHRRYGSTVVTLASRIAKGTT